MHPNPHVLSRLSRVRAERLRPASNRLSVPLEVTAWAAPGEPVPFSEAISQSFVALPRGTAWGRPWGTTWMRVAGTVPADWVLRDGERVEMDVDLGFVDGAPGFQAEGLVFSSDGRILKGIEPRNSWVVVDAAPGEDFELWMEAASNPDVAGEYGFAPTPLGLWETAGDDPLYVFRGIDLVVVDREIWELERDLDLVTGLLEHLPADRPRSARLTAAVADMLTVLDPHDVAGTAMQARRVLAPHLAMPAAASSHRVIATGHAHIDSAWLWPTRETIRKCARTFSNVLALMDEDDEFVFACSSAQQFAWVRTFYPELFARILDRVREGRFIPVGGMWVESDTNMPGSEAMVRQFVEGGAFFRDVLGVDADEVWLPDSFGYSAAMPQIARAAGARWFLTQKMSWNDTNRLPHHTFWWEGIDGTRVFTHFPPADTYNSDLSVADLDRAERQFAEKAYAGSSLLPFGFGNGGGGPTREMTAAAARARDVEGAPRVRMDSPASFFAEAEDEYGERAPVWAGEMYLELHRGVFSSQARTKRGNRRSEQLLHDAELWATTATVRAGAPYPAEELRELWRQTLLQQFHDILPGSSIAWVHREAEREYARIEATAERIVRDSLAVLAGPGDLALRVNSAPVGREGIPAMSAAPVAAGGWVEPVRESEGWVLANSDIRAVIDDDGCVRSLVDRQTGREYIPAGEQGAVPELLRDTATKWDAWEVDLLDRASTTELTRAESVRSAMHEGRPVVEVTRTFGVSSLRQRYSVKVGAQALDIDVEVDWNEDQKTLKLRLPFAVAAERYDSQIQFGHVSRSVHQNTSWDAARFEVCAHRFVHVAEPGAGIAVVNDGLYGHDVSRLHTTGGAATLVRPTLLRAPRFPDPDADRGFHRMTLRITPGPIPSAVAEGYALGDRIREVRGGREIRPLLRVEGAGVILETVKAAEDGSGDVVVRVYGCSGGRASARLHPDFAYRRAVVTDLHERGDQELPGEGAVDVELGPFEMRTIRFVRGSGAERDARTGAF